MKRIILKMRGADNQIRLYVLPTDDHYKITSLIEEYGLNDYNLISWKIEDITVLN